jgi:gluconate 2-dehydrogenase gamma chain
MGGTSRRDALRLIGAAPLAVGFGVSAAEALEASDTAARAVRAAAAAGQAYTPKFFTAHEWETVRVLVDLIIPRDERSGSATDAGVPEFMDTLMMDAADGPREKENRQTAMRGGLAWLDAQCRRRFGHDFTACTDAERTALLDDIAYTKKGDGQPHPFFAGFRDLTASGFWSSKLGIEDLGYQGNRFVREWKGTPPEVKAKLGVADE